MHTQVIVKSPGQALPALRSGQRRYVIARDGVYREQATKLYTASTLVDGALPELEPHDERCVLHCRPIPQRLITDMLGFFRYAYALHAGEAALVLLYHPERDEFEWYCPEQTVKLYNWRGGSYAEDYIEFEYPLEAPAGWLQFGDAHSHVGSPHPSYVDRSDERYRDGLHVIAGNIGTQRPTFFAEFRVHGQRFGMQPEALFESLPEAPYPEPPPEWRERIHLIQPSSPCHA